jgi:hypothetical protein
MRIGEETHPNKSVTTETNRYVNWNHENRWRNTPEQGNNCQLRTQSTPWLYWVPIRIRRRRTEPRIVRIPVISGCDWGVNDRCLETRIEGEGDECDTPLFFPFLHRTVHHYFFFHRPRKHRYEKSGTSTWMNFDLGGDQVPNCKRHDTQRRLTGKQKQTPLYGFVFIVTVNTNPLVRLCPIWMGHVNTDTFNRWWNKEDNVYHS